MPSINYLFGPFGLASAPLLYYIYFPVGLTFAPLINYLFRPVGLTFAPLLTAVTCFLRPLAPAVRPRRLRQCFIDSKNAATHSLPVEGIDRVFKFPFLV